MSTSFSKMVSSLSLSTIFVILKFDALVESSELFFFSLIVFLPFLLAFFCFDFNGFLNIK